MRRTLSVRLSVCPYVCPSVPLSLPSVTSFRQPLASRMYFSARTEGRISYGHLGRTNSCLLLSLIATIWYKLYNLASRGAARDHRKLTSGADGHLADGRSRHVVVDELSNLHQHQRVHVMRDVEVPVDDGADETRARQRITAARHSRRRYRCAHKIYRSNIPPDAMHKLIARY